MKKFILLILTMMSIVCCLQGVFAESPVWSGTSVELTTQDPTIHYLSHTSDIDKQMYIRISVHLPTVNQWITIYDEANTRDGYEYQGWIKYPASADKIRVETGSLGVGKPDWLYKDTWHRVDITQDLPGWGQNHDLDINYYTSWKNSLEFGSNWVTIS